MHWNNRWVKQRSANPAQGADVLVEKDTLKLQFQQMRPVRRTDRDLTGSGKVSGK